MKTVEFKDVVSISGMGGLFATVAQRPNGMIVRALGEEKSKLVSNRIHTFSPLDKIAIYTEDDSIPLIDVMRAMLTADTEQNNAPVSSKASSSDLKKYFRSILADYNEERVYVSDIKKIIKWYGILKDHDLILFEDPAEDDAEGGDEEE